MSSLNSRVAVLLKHKIGDCSCNCPLYSLYVVVGAGRSGKLTNGDSYKGIGFTCILLVSR